MKAKARMGLFEVPGNMFNTEECLKVYSLLNFVIEEAIYNEAMDFYIVIGTSDKFDEIEEDTVIPKYMIIVHNDGAGIDGAKVERCH